MVIIRKKNTARHAPQYAPQYAPHYAAGAYYRGGLLNFRESANLPAIAKMAGLSKNPKISQVVRQDTIYDTVSSMGLPVKINAMKNVVAEVNDSQTAAAVLSAVYQQFGVKGSFMITWEGRGKLYWAPDTPVDKAQMIAYANAAGLPPVNPRGYLA